MILDSSFLIDLMDGDQDAVVRAKVLDGEAFAQRIPTQVVYELYVGVGYTDTPSAEVSKIQSVIRTRPVIETTEQIAKLAGRIDGELRRNGNRVPEGDIKIAATARHFGEPVLTNNTDDFEKIPDVHVEIYK